MREFFGKYRGEVTDTTDPDRKGRIKVRVSEVYGDNDSGWALPSMPYGGSEIGFFAVPPVGTKVWVEFERGDSEFPVWSGCFWLTDTMPGGQADVDVKILKTANVTITLSDKQGESGLTLETSDGAKIVMDSNGIELDNGQGASIKLSSNSVKINDTALEVT